MHMLYAYKDINTHIIMMQRYINLHMFNTFHDTFLHFVLVLFLFIDKNTTNIVCLFQFGTNKLSHVYWR